MKLLNGSTFIFILTVVDMKARIVLTCVYEKCCHILMILKFSSSRVLNSSMVLRLYPLQNGERIIKHLQIDRTT